MAADPIRTVAIFNASEDTVEMLTTLLVDRGYRAVDGRVDDVKSGKFDFIEFMETNKPDAVVWDIAPPYDRNWTFFKLLRSIGPLDGCPIVLTTTHKEHLDSLIGRDSGAIEIVGKPYDLKVIADAVTRAIDRQDSAGPRWGHRQP
jgi:CheY-like chemotaxis protein